MKYMIAYSDKDGKDFFGLPWLLPDVFWEKYKAFQKLSKLRSDGAKQAIVFQVNEEDIINQEDFDWSYVIQNMVR